MAVAIPSDWTLQEEREITPGGPICLPGVHDLGTLNQRVNRAWAAARRQVFAWGGLGGGSGAREHDEAGVTSPALRYDGIAPYWSTSGRFKLHVYGQNVDVVAEVGGQSGTAASCGGTLGWASSASFDLSGMTLVSGTLRIKIYAEQNAASGDRAWAWWVLEEEERQSLPQLGDSETSFARLDDLAFVADYPLDGLLLQRLVVNLDETERLRTRGCCQVYPDDEPFTCSSAWWRSDGPHELSVEPWSDRITVAVLAEATDYDVELCAFSEYEDRTIAIARAVTLTAGAGATVCVFTGLLARSTEGSTRPCRVWLGFRSATGSETSYSPASVIHVESNGERQWLLDDDRYLTPNLPRSEPADWPVGRMLIVEAERFGFEAGETSVLTQSPDFVEFDLAANMFVPGSTDEDGKILVTPCNQGSPIPFGPWEARPAAVYELGVLSIKSVALCGARARGALIDDDTYAAAAVGELAPWTIPEEVRQRVNALARFATPQLCCRHRGQLWLHGSTSSSGKTIYQRGRYVFCTGLSGSAQPVERIAVLDPTESTGINPSLLRVRVQYACFRLGAEDEVTLTWTLSHGGSTQGTTDTTVNALPPATDTWSVARWAAAMAAVCVSRDGSDLYEHGYVQQAGYLQRGEEFTGIAKWDEVEITCDLPASSPAFVELEVDSSSTRTWVVVVGLEAEICERG